MITEAWKSRVQVERRDQFLGLKQWPTPKASKIELDSLCIESKDMITETWMPSCNGGLQDEQGDQVSHLKKKLIPKASKSECVGTLSGWLVCLLL